MFQTPYDRGVECGFPVSGIPECRIKLKLLRRRYLCSAFVGQNDIWNPALLECIEPQAKEDASGGDDNTHSGIRGARPRADPRAALAGSVHT